ncbi:poly-gamma-glutamate synthesis protein (capsule biosynthesis protein) [Prauserella shujinwangii]|uniref:Poly-gamma-glutamate synthesis protein (Capsule biosynthesis protein) n=1 Tax=Prauserella shujinwangii TaxID=1453103 RepID=A0A2T0LZ37_9PSEU|nr:CapA family protein [Prauserella shujinwangii]PRX49360.1 poly-gamma-glutamate synthesis protein (capsule biosynthesis protein) [Prauserella shujinwangii]
MRTLFLCGDVMPGRGIDQVLPHPGEPWLRERVVRDARDYVRLAELCHGPVAAPVPYSWPWGEALDVIEAERPDARVLNLETAVTERGAFAPGKGVHYRMTPANLPALLAARPDVCVLANNHVLDFGHDGLSDTLDALAAAGLTVAGAGPDGDAAARPATVGLPGGNRMCLLAAAAASSGVPPGWAAAAGTPGVHLLPDLSDRTAERIADRLAAEKRPGDVAVFSVHWGSNWGYDVPDAQVRFAHRLVELGVDVVHGHSAHHPRPVEVYGGGLILYGCGDLVNDYEGITGAEKYRGDLRLLYFPSFDERSGRFADLRMWPVRARRLRLESAPGPDAAWLHRSLDRVSARFGTRIVLEADGWLGTRPG